MAGIRTAALPVGRIGRQAGDAPDVTGWQMVALPYREEMKGQWTPITVEAQDEHGKPMAIQVVFTKVGLRNLKGLRKHPIAGWDGRFHDFPAGSYTFLALKRAYGGAGDASLLSESSIEMSDEEEEPAATTRQRKVPPTTTLPASAKSPSDKGGPSPPPPKRSVAYEEAMKKRTAADEAAAAAAEAAKASAPAPILALRESPPVKEEVVDDLVARDELVGAVLSRTESPSRGVTSSRPSTPVFGFGGGSGGRMAELIDAGRASRTLPMPDDPRMARPPPRIASPRSPPGPVALPEFPSPETRSQREASTRAVLAESRAAGERAQLELDRQMALGLARGELETTAGSRGGVSRWQQDDGMLARAEDQRRAQNAATKAEVDRLMQKGDHQAAMRALRQMVEADDEADGWGPTGATPERGSLFGGNQSSIHLSSGDEIPPRRERSPKPQGAQEDANEELRMLREQHRAHLAAMDEMRDMMKKLSERRSQSPPPGGGLFGGGMSSKPSAEEEAELRQKLGQPPSGLRPESAAAGRTSWRDTWRAPAEGVPEEVRRMPAESSKGAGGATGAARTTSTELGSDHRDILNGLVALGRGEFSAGGGDLLGNDQRELDRFGGSRGATAFAKEQLRFEEDPWAALLGVDRAGREMCGVRAGQAHRMEDALLRLPLGTYVTKKRAGFIMACAAEALLQDNVKLAGGILAQGLRWISLSLTLKDEDSAWKISYLRDPKDVVTPAPPARPDLLQCQMQDVRQLTALCGLLRDEDSLGLRMAKAGKKPYKGKGKEKEEG